MCCGKMELLLPFSFSIVFLFSYNSTFQRVLFLLYYSNLPILFIKKWQIMFFINLELRLRPQDNVILVITAARTVLHSFLLFTKHWQWRLHPKMLNKYHRKLHHNNNYTLKKIGLCGAYTIQVFTIEMITVKPYAWNNCPSGTVRKNNQYHLTKQNWAFNSTMV